MQRVECEPVEVFRDLSAVLRLLRLVSQRFNRQTVTGKRYSSFLGVSPFYRRGSEPSSCLVHCSE
jgi:hypothetical protein